jgi:hypothetical protein
VEASFHNFLSPECGFRKKFGDSSMSLAIKLKVNLEFLNEERKPYRP